MNDMRLFTSLLLGTAILIPAAGEASRRADPEARLQEAIAGRSAGAPVDCIDLSRVHSSYIIDGTAIVYEVGRTTYVNRPVSGGKSLDKWDTLVTETYSDRLCSRDTVKLIDPTVRMQTGLVFLGKFVPYRLAEKTAR